MNDMSGLPAGQKKVFVKTYGCQMNVYDSTRMEEILAGQGYVRTEQPNDADLVILNTCHIREKAAEKVYSELGLLRRMKDERRAQGAEMVIAVAGCVAQAEGEEIIARAKTVDLVFGPQTFHRLPDYLARHRQTGAPVVETEFPADEKFAELAVRKAVGNQVAAFLTVQEGCDKFCTFCVVPYTRGAEFSRPVAQVLSEARALAAAGVSEVTLLGQNVNAYRGAGASGGETSLAGLVSELSRIDGIERIRYMTSHPRDMSDDLIEAHAANGKLMPYLHLPVQAGSDRVLKAMNRGHTADDYLKLIARVRAARPDMAMSGDFIVGFPGESDAEFEDTIAVAKAVGYAAAYSFKYSPRPGTPAAELARQVPEEVKSERLQRLQALIIEQQQAFNRSCLGRTLPVLIEKPGRHDGQMIGRSPYLQSVNLKISGNKRGKIVPVAITGVGPNSLSGQYVEADSLLSQRNGERDL
ncbi:MAG: tRNA (N6-isopentenyl adenosine(37)-C2)-methylthiotransferase MiaB [Proteobacteria bacterium]|nr:tRNA (N6-isopentenyl adenosine(37)-C2)-methylthiotransferase MiaB [Pseudomonadota bacterium]